MAVMFYGLESRIFAEIQAEVNRSRKLHPNYATEPLRRGAILIEEGLEAAEVIVGRMVSLQKTILGHTRISNKEFTADDLRKELIQTGAMAVKFLIAIEEEKQNEDSNRNSVAPAESSGDGVRGE